GALGEARTVQEVRHDLELEIDRRAQHAHLDVDAVAGARALQERGQDSHRQERGAVLVDDGRADWRRWLPGATRDARETREGLEEKILPGPVAVRARLAVSGGRDVHEPRIPGPRRLPAETETLHHTRPEVLNQDVGALDETSGDREPLGVLEIERETPLVPVRG